MRRVMVTGSNGQLGKSLQDLAKDYPDLDFVFADSNALNITNAEVVNAIFDSGNFDYCINCAAYTTVDKAESDKENVYLVNAEAVKYLAGACKTNNTIFIHISTDFVFDGTKGTPYTEDDLPNPLNVYGASKLKGEQYVQQILEKYFIIRTSWVYSEYGNNFVKTMLRLGNERDEISIVSDQIGSPTYARDLAEVILKIISEKATDYGVYHYSNEGEISWYDFAKTIFEIKGMDTKVNPIPSKAYPTPAKRPTFSVMDKTKIKQILDINTLDWKNSLKKYLTKINDGKPH